MILICGWDGIDRVDRNLENRNQEPGKIRDGLIGCEKEMEEERIQRPLTTEANGLKERTLTLPLQNLAL